MARSAIGRFVKSLNRRAVSRQRFLEGFAASIFTVPALGAWPRGSVPAGTRVAIVGCGAAGMTCAYRLHQAGVAATVYEANSRIGGRTWTLRGFFAGGQRAEHGGQLIASSHRAVRDLCHELGLQLTDLNALYPQGVVDTYVIGGARYPVDEAIADYDRYVFRPLRQAAIAAGYPTTYDRHTRAGVTLDRMNVDQWLDRNVAGGSASKIGRLLRLACISEYGADASVQSALNLIYLLEDMPKGRLNLSGTGEDDRFHIAAGSEALVDAMAARLPSGSIHVNTALVALARRADGSYACTFSAPNGATRTIAADRVVLSIPFTVLRRVDLRAAGFSARKMAAIRELDLGSNAKVHLQFANQYWFAKGYSGTAYADAIFQDAWDAGIGEPGSEGLLVCFPGGSAGASFTGPVHGAASPSIVRSYLASLEPVLPGASAAFNGKAYQDFWIADPFTRGAYAYYKVGQFTTLAGIEGLREGNVHFCGEQTSYDWQGYINGAVASGERAAREILS